jgi:hypothetical protein
MQDEKPTYACFRSAFISEVAVEMQEDFRRFFACLSRRG